MSTEVVAKQPTLKIRDKLVDTIEKQEVPNHVLNSKIYAKLQRNDYFEIQPSEVHFSGFEIDTNEGVKKYRQTVRIINISDQVQRMTVLPPSTKFFEIYYVKSDRLVPGFALEIQITFKPNEYKYYNDSIRIHSKGDENLIIPLHAYPIISSFDFPNEYKFPNTPIGKSVTRSFTLRSTAPVIFEFMIQVLDKHPSFQISPLTGIIPYNEDVNISITFTPTEFCTAIMIIQLIVSQFNSKPIICKFYGISTPGLSRDQLNRTLPVINDTNNIVDARVLSPLDLARLKRKTRERDDNVKTSEVIEKDGLRFPKDLNSVWSISKVLNQKKGKLSLKEMKSNSQAFQVTKQFKETAFLKNVLELEDEERRNQLKWQVKIGDTSIDNQTRADILASRSKAEYEYRLSIGEPVISEELKRRKASFKQVRTVRSLDTVLNTDINFDMFKNELWSNRYQATCKFSQAIRKVIIRNRLISRLNSLKMFANEWFEALSQARSNDSTILLENFIEIYEKLLRGERIEQDITITSLNARSIGTYYFPIVDSDDASENTNLDSLGMVNANSIEFSIDVQIPYLNLAIPKQYELNDYKIKIDNSYVNKYESRIGNLRKGAQDELIEIDIGKKIEPIKLEQEDEIKEKNEEISEQMETTSFQIIDVETPMDLLKEDDYHPMHIFNPAPGLISYQKLLPYSGIELNHHLNPLPRFEKNQTNSTQKKFLDHDDVIKGIMSWKKFPSQGLTSLSNTPTLTDVWVPRWSNVFGTELLPLETPPLLANLPEDDKDNLFEEQDDENGNNDVGQIFLTPEMVNAQFNIPQIFENRQQTLKEELLKRKKAKQFYSQSNISKIQFPYSDKLPATNLPVSTDGPVLREQREQELEYFLNKQYNELGLRIKTKINNLYNPISAQQQQQQQLQDTDEQLENDDAKFNSESKTNLSFKDF